MLINPKYVTHIRTAAYTDQIVFTVYFEGGESMTEFIKTEEEAVHLWNKLKEKVVVPNGFLEIHPPELKLKEKKPF